MIIQCFFIQLDCFGKLWEWDISFYRKFISFQDFADMLGFAFFGESFFFSNLCDLVHSDGYGLTVAFSFVVEMLLNGVGKGMSEIQKNSLSGIEFVFFYNAAFDIDAGCDHICQMFFQILIGSAFFQKIKELTVFDASVFDDFSHTVCHITFRQGFQYIRIDQYHLWLIKCSYQVLALWQVNCNFSADRGIYLCKD